MFRSRVGVLARPALAATLSGASQGCSLFASVRFEATLSPTQRVRAAAAAAAPSSSFSSFAQKVKMASADATTSNTVVTDGRAADKVRPVAPPTAADDAEGAPVRKVIKKKKIIKRIVRKAGSSAEGDGEAATVSTGEALRHELRAASSVEPEAASASAPRDQPPQKTSLVKGYRIDEVTSLCTASDAIFARRLPAGGCQFFAWPGTPLEVASAAIVSMPDTIRTVHAVFGRYKTPIDLVMDVDCPVPQEHWSMSKIRPFQKKLLDDTLSVVTEELAKIGEQIETQVVLQSPNLKKASFHIHTKLKDAAFDDFNSLHGFLARFHDRIPTVDLQIYRTNGMLRMFSCMKENHTSAMTVFDDPDWNIGFKDGKVPDEAAALHSVIVRPAGTFKRLIKFDPPRATFQPAHRGERSDDSGEASGEAPAWRHVVTVPLTEREAVENASRWLRGATEVEVGEWRSWIGLGLCAYRIAYHFKDARTLRRPAMEELLEAWVEGSRHCPSKFRQGDCEQRWAGFDINKLQTHSDWWSAYLRLGKLEVATRESLAQHEATQTKKRAGSKK